MELSVHEMEPGVDRPSVDRTEDLLFARRPLASSCSKSFVETSFCKPCVLPLLCYKVSAALLEMCEQVFPHKLVHGEDDGAGEGEEGPVAKVHSGVRFWMIGRLLYQLQEDLVYKAIFFHRLVKDSLD